MDYLKDPDAIYRKSFATVRAEADLARFPANIADVVVRMIHACGMPAIAADVAFTPGAAALDAGRPILVDARMVEAGIIRRNLTGDNPIVCTLDAPGVAEDAKTKQTTRSAVAVEKWLPDLAGAIVVIGNAPTALFRLLEIVADGAPKPALVLGFPVGFVGAAESKEALVENSSGLDFIALRGRFGGSAIAAAALNAIAGAGA
ncbi:MAG: precorrin-8X methylmutase [Proteobacteria bacterium]|nr:precorrin-8X methylmutase [Pseudomonadota bacterium]